MAWKLGVDAVKAPDRPVPLSATSAVPPSPSVSSSVPLASPALDGTNCTCTEQEDWSLIVEPVQLSPPPTMANAEPPGARDTAATDTSAPLLFVKVTCRFCGPLWMS